MAGRSLDFAKLCDDHDIQYAGEGDRHYHEGWISVECPFCSGNPGFHLGFNIDSNFFTCWRCGYKTVHSVIKKLLGIDGISLKQKLREYYGEAIVSDHKLEVAVKQQIKSIKLPPGTNTLKKMHCRYLRKRKFDPLKLQQIWGILGTGNLGPFCFRIIIPVYFKGKLVSYQGRDISNKSTLRYKNCPKEKEIVHLKDIVYGFDNVPKKTVVICEGVTDVWRLGPGAVATFGVSYTPKQVKLLGNNFSTRFILYDQDEAGRIRASSLAKKLAMYDGKTTIVVLKNCKVKDPGDLPQKDADKIMKELLSYEN